MLKVICDKCGKESEVKPDLAGFTTIGGWIYTDELDDKGERIPTQVEFHCCDDCIESVRVRNEEYKAKVDKAAAKQDKVVVPATDKFKVAQKKLSEEMNDWVTKYFGK